MSTLQYSEDFYLRKSVRYGKEPARNRRVYPGSAYRSHPDKVESLSINSIDLNDEFKFLPDDSVARDEVSEPVTPIEVFLSNTFLWCLELINGYIFVWYPYY